MCQRRRTVTAGKQGAALSFDTQVKVATAHGVTAFASAPFASRIEAQLHRCQTHVRQRSAAETLKQWQYTGGDVLVVPTVARAHQLGQPILVSFLDRGTRLEQRAQYLNWDMTEKADMIEDVQAIVTSSRPRIHASIHGVRPSSFASSRRPLHLATWTRSVINSDAAARATAGATPAS